MQWNAGTNAGFSQARRAELCTPVVSRGPFGYRRVNVAEQQRDTDSLLNWMERAIGARWQCPELGQGAWEPLATGHPSVMALRFHDSTGTVISVHNLSAEPRRARLGDAADGTEEVFGNRRYGDPASGSLELDAYGYRWLRMRAG
jgi:maltose alpha-D-glucosyltransferase / alpha-amylase